MTDLDHMGKDCQNCGCYLDDAGEYLTVKGKTGFRYDFLLCCSCYYCLREMTIVTKENEWSEPQYLMTKELCDHMLKCEREKLAISQHLTEELEAMACEDNNSRSRGPLCNSGVDDDMPQCSQQ